MTKTKEHAIHILGLRVLIFFGLFLSFCHPVIQKFIVYDNAHKTSLLPTLEAYLQYVDTPNIAAKTLFIHRNTLFYRINRIRELFEIDLSDGDSLLKLQLTLHFLKLKTQRDDPKDQSIEG